MLKSLAEEKRLAPGPKKRMLIGQLPEFVLDPFKFLTGCNDRYGDIVQFHVPIFGRVYLLNRPDYIEQVLVSNQRNFVRPRFFENLRPVLGNGVALSEGELWLRQRRMMQPSFHRERIAAYANTMTGEIAHMLEGWQANEVRSIDREMTVLALEVVTRALLGTNLAAKARAISGDFKTTVAEFSDRLTNPVHLPEFIPTPRNRRYRKARTRLDQTIYELISQRRADLASNNDGGDESHAKNAGSDFLSACLQARDEVDGSQMSDRQLHDEALTILLGGHESTATILTWTWYLLSQYPAVEAKLHRELDEVLAGRTPTISDLHHLTYTAQLVKEVLRLYPVLWFIVRRAVQGFELGGYYVPAGTTLMASPWSVQRNPHYFSDPDQFKPERWEDPQLVKQLPKFAYFPFGGGPRQCIGNNFALLEIPLVVAMVGQRFRLDLAPGQRSLRLAARMTLRPRDSLKMVLIERSRL